MVPVRNCLPAGNTTWSQAVIALAMARLSSALPSPFAPCSITEHFVATATAAGCSSALATRAAATLAVAGGPSHFDIPN